jgi:hypothetical protein
MESTLNTLSPLETCTRSRVYPLAVSIVLTLVHPVEPTKSQNEIITAGLAFSMILCEPPNDLSSATPDQRRARVSGTDNATRRWLQRMVRPRRCHNTKISTQSSLCSESSMRRKISSACGPATSLMYHGQCLAIHRSNESSKSRNRFCELLCVMRWIVV